MFTLIDRLPDRSVYGGADNTLEMVLLHDPKKKSQIQYHNKINLIAALATYKCAISLVGASTPAMQPKNVIETPLDGSLLSYGSPSSNATTKYMSMGMPPPANKNVPLGNFNTLKSPVLSAPVSKDPMSNAISPAMRSPRGTGWGAVPGNFTPLGEDSFEDSFEFV
jgi:hypothetical protein